MPDLTRRLSALERQVERALAATEAGVSTLPSVDSLLDGVTVGVDNVFRVLGGEPEATAAVFETSLDFLARRWWRIEVLGRERLPRRGPMLLVANRVPAAVPYEALVVARALSQGAPQAAVVRPLVDPWLLELPVVGATLRALGARPATRLAARAVLEAGVPVIPVAVIGAEDAQPVVGRVPGLGWLGLPAVPITPVLFPLPTKWTVHVGDSLAVPSASADAPAMQEFQARVRERLQGLLSDAVRRRPGLFA